MAKKHKAKGNQQKPHKRKSFRDNQSGDNNGTSSHAFSMRDEVLNTERHHSAWTQASKLRDQAIRFVSAGQMLPLDETKREDAPEASALLQKCQPIAADLALGGSDVAMARMDLQSSTEQSSTDAAVYIHTEMEASVPETDVITHTAQPTSNDESELDADHFFVVDASGDKSLVPPNVPKGTPRPLPESDSEGDEDVVVFRGRRDRVTTLDDPVPESNPSFARTRPHPFSGPLPPEKVPTQMHGSNAAMRERSIPQSKVVSPLNAASASALRAAVVDNDGALDIARNTSNASRAEKKARRSSQLRRGTRGNGSSLPSARAPGRRLAQGVSAEDEHELADAVYQDYIANTSGLEELVGHLQGGSDDEWVSSEMEGVEEYEIEAAIEASLAGRGVSPPSQSNRLALPSSLLGEDVEMTEVSAVTSGWEDDNVDDEEADDTSDPGDDSELESDLEYTEQERWEDEEDLRQRHIDSLTDEEIARLLAKQEDLGLGADELLLLDDATFGAGDVGRAQDGLDAILANPNHPSHKRKGKGKRRDHFPSASLMADVLDEDPYGGFDVMDFDRPSLRNTGRKKGRKSAGPLPEELLDLTDDEMINELQATWANDRQKKASKKQERNELRAQGLLGRANKFAKANMAIKFAEGLSLEQLRTELEDFLDDEGASQKAFPPMEKRERKLLHEIANALDMTSTSRGSGAKRFTVLSKRARTPDTIGAAQWLRVERIANRGFIKGTAGKARKNPAAGIPGRAGRGGGFSKAAVGYANGEVVGAAAPEIAEGNFGRKLMEKMGWEKGMALGKGGEGMLLPVEARVKSGRGGLG